ncbi:MAG: hypothetical protein ACYDAO_01755 [Thermoplasmataceae archaeon]
MEKEGIVDGCFFTWVAVTEKYMKEKGNKTFNTYKEADKSGNK